MRSERLESFWARVCGDPAAREAFLADPVGEATRAGLDPAEVASVAAVDREALELEARHSRREAAGVVPGAPVAAARGVRRALFGIMILAVCAGIGVLWHFVVRTLAAVGAGAGP